MLNFGFALYILRQLISCRNIRLQFLVRKTNDKRITAEKINYDIAKNDDRIKIQYVSEQRITGKDTLGMNFTRSIVGFSPFFKNF